MSDSGKKEFFYHFAHKASIIAGTGMVFALAFAVICGWILSGPYFGFSDTWQLIINTSTTIVTFLMVFLIQNTQNRESLVVQLKLDELISGIQGPRNQMVSLEECTEEELLKMKREFDSEHRKANPDDTTAWISRK